MTLKEKIMARDSQAQNEKEKQINVASKQLWEILCEEFLAIKDGNYTLTVIHLTEQTYCEYANEYFSFYHIVEEDSQTLGRKCMEADIEIVKQLARENGFDYIEREADASNIKKWTFYMT